MTGVGVAAATFTWATITMLGFGSLVTRLGWLYLSLKFFGAAYLIWLGAIMILSSRKAGLYRPSAPISSIRLDAWHSFRGGYVTSMTNPKAAAFFGSIFILVIPPNFPVYLQIATVLLLSISSAAWHCGLALFFSTEVVRDGYLRAKTKIDAVIGTILIAVGLRLAFTR